MATYSDDPFIRRKKIRPGTSTLATTGVTATSRIRNPISEDTVGQAVGAAAAALTPPTAATAATFASRANQFNPVSSATADLVPPAPTAAPTPASASPLTHTEMAADIARRNLTAAGSSFGEPQQQDTTATARLPFVSGGYQFPSGTQLPEGFQEDNAGGLTARTNPITARRYSSQPFVEGGYVFPSGSPLPEGFQESGGGGGLTRQVPQEEDKTTVHFLPPGFTATTGSTGVPGSTPNDIHFLPPGFTSVQGVTNPITKQLQQPEDKDRYGSAYGY